MPEDSVEETKSGVKKKGDWEDISDFAREAEKVIEDGEIDDESLQKFERWRPREKEDEEDLKERTVEEAQLSENDMEKESSGVKNDVEEASQKAVEASKKLKDGEDPGEDVKKASEGFLRPFYSEFAGKFRALEKFVYSNLMLRLNPYYFDSGGISADVKDEGSGEYEMSVNVSENDTRGKLKEEFEADSE